MSFISILQGGEAAKQLGTYSKAIADRDATIIRQEQAQAWQFYEDFEKPKFDKTAEEIRDQLEVSYLKSGVTMEGTPMESFIEQDYQLLTDSEILKFNATNAKSRSENAAIMRQTEGMLAKWEGKLRKQQSYYEAGSSLLSDAATVYGVMT
jgi:hypothetical protein